MKRRSFIFYADWLDALESLPRDVRDDALYAIVVYGIRGEEYEQLRPIAKVVLGMAKGSIDANYRKWENGCKGGAPRGNQNARKQSVGDQKQPKNNQKQPMVELKTTEKQPKNNQKQPKNNQKQPNVNVNDNDNDFVLLNAKQNESTLLNESKAMSFSEKNDDAAAANAKEKTQERKQANETIDFYNAQIVAQNARLSVCRARTERRLSAIMGRIREYGEETVRQAIDKAMKSRFLNYDATNAPVDLEWIMRPNNFPKVLEGRYDNKQRGKPEEVGVILRQDKDRYENQELW